jgi:hypothetical protein
MFNATATMNRQVLEQKQNSKVILEKQLKVTEEREVSTKNRVKNLHESTIKMILFVSRLGGEGTSSELW